LKKKQIFEENQIPENFGDLRGGIFFASKNLIFQALVSKDLLTIFP
jgi:hypothetical protein